MIADVDFGPSVHGVRRLRFARRSSIPLGAACMVASGMRETLRELLGETCELDLGEPVAIDAEAWAVLAADSLLFLTRGRQTDIVLLLPRADARRLIVRAFGETEEDGNAQLPDRACSALELHAIERIAARCAATFDALCSERRPGTRAVAANAAPACIAYFDVRVREPLALTLGIGIVRELPDPGPTGTLPPAALGDVALDMRATFAEGTIDVPAFVALRPGDLIKLDTRLGARASLHVGGRPVAVGIPGARASRAALFVGGAPVEAQVHR